MIRPLPSHACETCAQGPAAFGCGAPVDPFLKKGETPAFCAEWEPSDEQVREQVAAYWKWIKDNVDPDDRGYGKCEQLSAKMAEAFPELTRVRGFYFCPCWGERMHWWCVDESAKLIVDPTSTQFPTGGRGVYDPVDESQPETIPTGKCLDCGAFTYNGETFCSELCRKRTTEYMNSDPFNS